MKTDNIIVEKSKAFAIRIINSYKYLCEEKHEYFVKTTSSFRNEHRGKC